MNKSIYIVFTILLFSVCTTPTYAVAPISEMPTPKFQIVSVMEYTMGYNIFYDVELQILNWNEWVDEFKRKRNGEELLTIICEINGYSFPGFREDRMTVEGVYLGGNIGDGVYRTDVMLRMVDCLGVDGGRIRYGLPGYNNIKLGTVYPSGDYTVDPTPVDFDSVYPKQQSQIGILHIYITISAVVLMLAVLLTYRR